MDRRTCVSRMPLPSRNCWVRTEGKGLQPAYRLGTDNGGMTFIQWKSGGKTQLVPSIDVVLPIAAELRSNRRKLQEPRRLVDEGDWTNSACSKKAKLDHPAPSGQAKLKKSPARFPLNTRVCKYFRGREDNGEAYDGWFEGNIDFYNGSKYRIVYSDGDSEDLTHAECSRAIKKYEERNQQAESTGASKATPSDWGTPSKLAERTTMSQSSSGKESGTSKTTPPGWGTPSNINAKENTAQSTSGSENPNLETPTSRSTCSQGWGNTSKIGASGWGTPSCIAPQNKTSRSDCGKETGWGTPSNVSTQRNTSLSNRGWATPNLDSPAVSSSIPNQHAWGTRGQRAGRSPASFLSDCAGRLFPVAAPKAMKKQPPAEMEEHAGEEVMILEEESNKEQYFLKWLWGERLLIRIKLLSDKGSIDTSIEHNGCCYQLVASKMVENRGRSIFDTKKVKFFYLAESGPNFKTISIRKELEKLFDFAAKSTEKGPTKVVSALELFVSPALKGKFGSQIYKLKKSDFELIEENANVGCGFIPQNFIRVFLAPNIVGTAPVVAIQIRAFVPKLGLFKGMLMVKPEISKIQLPDSMMKVQRSSASIGQNFGWGLLIVTGTFPSTPCLEMNKFLNPNIDKIPRDDYLLGKQFKDVFQEGTMFRELLKSNGVPEHVLEDYHTTSAEWSYREHFSVVGVADPTHELPEEHVFLTGVGTRHSRCMTTFCLFASRFPCPQKKDGVTLTAVLSKPAAMSSSNWQFLSSLPFGTLVFGPPRQGLQPIPERVGEGDLDGDQYIVCWNKEIVSHIASASTDTESITEDEALDDLVGSELHYEGKPAIICRKISGFYEVEVGRGIGSFTRLVPEEEILREYDVLEEILDHRSNGKGRTEIKIKWKQREPTWELLTHRKIQFASELAEYARKNCLLDDNNWRWAKNKVFEAEIVGILGHRNARDGVQVQLSWEDGTRTWNNLKDMKDDARDYLVSYASENSLQEMRAWTWVKKHLREMKKDWFQKVQKNLADVNQMREHDRLTGSLFGGFKKCLKNHEVENAEAFGRAFKDSIDIRKHDGKVNLPVHLQLRLREKCLDKYFGG